MAEVIRMPRMSDTMEEGVVVGWLKKVGDSIEPGDVLAEVETDKATMELESFQEGTLLHIGIKEGPVPVNGILAVIGEEGEDYKEALAQAEADVSNTPQVDEEANKEEKESDTLESTPKEEVVSDQQEDPKEKNASTDNSSDTRIKASPLAKKMASEKGIKLSEVEGSGDNGRIVKKDIESYETSKGKSTVRRESNTTSKEGSSTTAIRGEEVPVSQMRKTIARRLGESKFSAPHFYLTIEVDMTKSIETRKQINEISPTRISFNDLVVKACAVALRQHPAINSSWLGDKIRYNSEINVGVAVAVEEGLLVPVINQADMKSLSQINEEVKFLAAKAKEKKLQPKEMQGNTFTISNLGMFDIDEFTAIINPPDACILAVGTIVEKPVVKNGEIIIGNIMKLTLSCDHRVVDGATGAKFLQTVKAMLEDPIRMIV